MTGDILYTWILTYPRMILSEFNTHRTFSRNTSSNRAIPSRKPRQRVLHDPFVPVWQVARLPQVLAAFALECLGVHKQIANRLAEPWTWTQQVASATDVENFFWLRDHHMAEPHFAELASQMHSLVIEQSWYSTGSAPTICGRTTASRTFR